MERFTLDGTKIKANASGNTFRRKEKIEEHLALARRAGMQKINEQKRRRRKCPCGKGLPHNDVQPDNASAD